MQKMKDQTRDTRINNWPREPRLVSNFTDSGKKCLLRLQKQVEKRLPAPKANQCLSVLLDPVTKQFAKSLLSENGLYNETRALLKEKHRDAYTVLHAPKPSPEVQVEDEEEAEDKLAEPAEVPNAGFNDAILNLTCEVAPPVLEETETSNIHNKADEVFEEWMNHVVMMHPHSFDSKNPIPKNGNVSLLELVAKFDTMKYFRDVGKKEWPSITILARIHFSKMDNSAFQERVFSTASNTQRKTQSGMKVDHLEKWILIAHDKELIRGNII